MLIWLQVCNAMFSDAKIESGVMYMDMSLLTEKKKVANGIVNDYASRYIGQDNCEADAMVEICKSMWMDIGKCFGYIDSEYKRYDDEFFCKYGKNMEVMRKIRQDVQQILLPAEKPEARAFNRFAMNFAQPPMYVIRFCGNRYVHDFVDWFEHKVETELIEYVIKFAKKHRKEYAEWLKMVTKKSKMPMIGQIGRDFLESDMEYGCKRDTYPRLREEEYWLMNAWKAGDGWAAFTHGCLCYYGAVRWKVAVECYDKAKELLLKVCL